MLLLIRYEIDRVGGLLVVLFDIDIAWVSGFKRNTARFLKRSNGEITIDFASRIVSSIYAGNYKL